MHSFNRLIIHTHCVPLYITATLIIMDRQLLCEDHCVFVLCTSAFSPTIMMHTSMLCDPLFTIYQLLEIAFVMVRM